MVARALDHSEFERTMEDVSAVWHHASMSNLRDDNPAVCRDFVLGLHVARRSNCLWAGLSTDLVIEQVLMRSLATSGSLTRGRGFTEQQRLIWLLSMPACAERRADRCEVQLG